MLHDLVARACRRDRQQMVAARCSTIGTASLGAFWQVVPKEMLDRLAHPLDDSVELVAAE